MVGVLRCNGSGSSGRDLLATRVQVHAGDHQRSKEQQHEAQIIHVLILACGHLHRFIEVNRNEPRNTGLLHRDAC